MSDPSRSDWDRLAEAFDELETMPEMDREARLAQIAAKDRDLAEELRELLGEYDADRQLEIERLFTDDTPQWEQRSVGRQVGPYRLVEVLGRGGMGEVFLAERTDGEFEQHVALKLVRSAFDDPQARSRFRAERQILARLQHPSVARLLDGGVSDDGAPYLAMEFIRGEEITDYCDRLELGVTDRLELLIQVCKAVHSAHRQLVIHRDLKPSNIMVDGDGEVKLLDFGIAKILSPDGTDSAGLTQTGAFLLTPEYASPEQVAGEPIGTSSDVYAIGLVAYRLLTGLAGQPVETRSPVGIQQAVCLTTPRTMSQAVCDDVGGSADDRARLRGGLSSAGLSRRLAGDLDVIIEKALRKEPDRRYLSAEDLAADLRRHLARKPVEARGDRFGYRAARFVSRHKAAVLATSAAFIALAVSLLVSLTSLDAARRSEARAVAEAESSRQLVDFVIGLFDASDPTAAPGDEITARSLLDRGAESLRDGDIETRPELAGDMLMAIGGAYDKLGLSKEAVPFLEEAVELHATPEDPEGHARALRALATAQLTSGSYDVAVENSQRAVELLEAAEDVEPREMANAYSDLGIKLFAVRRSADAIPVLESAIGLRRSFPDPEVRRLAIDLDCLGNSVFEGGDFDAGLAILREAINTLERADAASWEIADNLTRLGLRLVAAGRFDEAEIELDRSLGLARTAAGDGRHPEVQDALLARATLSERRGRFGGAAADLELALAESLAVWGPEHPKTSMVRLRRGKVLLADQHYDEAIIELRAGRETLAARTGGHRAHLFAFDLPLGEALMAAGRTGEAIELLRPIAADPKSRYAEPAQQLLDAHDS